jgi:tetratricopeptide (TPR) repeat protein
LSAADERWTETIEHAQAALAVNPLIPAPHRYLAQAAEQTGDKQQALAGLTALLELDPFDPAQARYRVARLLHQTGDASAARRQVLMALEEAPRFRDAQQLLLEILEIVAVEENPPEAAPETATEASSEAPPPSRSESPAALPGTRDKEVEPQPAASPANLPPAKSPTTNSPPESSESR